GWLPRCCRSAAGTMVFATRPRRGSHPPSVSTRPATAGGAHPSSADRRGQPESIRTTSRRIGGPQALHRREQMPVDHLSKLLDRVEIENDSLLPTPAVELGYPLILVRVDPVRSNRPVGEIDQDRFAACEEFPNLLNRPGFLPAARRLQPHPEDTDEDIRVEDKLLVDQRLRTTSHLRACVRFPHCGKEDRVELLDVDIIPIENQSPDLLPFVAHIRW